MLEIENLTHIYGEGGPNQHHAIDQLSLNVADGELLCIVGPSGCGKSTLLRSIAGLITPTGGRIKVDGQLVRETPDNLAVVFQDYSRSLFPWMSVADNVELPLRRKGLDRRRRREAAAEALAAVGLLDAGNKYPFQLSGGMQQRVAIARSLAEQPRLLLMDEPFGALDEMTRERMQAELSRIVGESGAAVVFVTHSIPEAVFLSDRVVVMSPRPGRITGVVDIGIGRDVPRDESLRETTAFFAKVTEVREALHGTPVTASGREGR